MKKQNLKAIALLFCVLIINSCGKDDEDKGTCTDGIQNQSETGVDCGGPCTACPTCTDGIQNQSETGVDCGGPCGACPVICTGNGQNSYFPMAQNNVWKYGGYSDTTSDYQITISGTQVFNSVTYNKFAKDDYFSSLLYFYYRVDGSGNIHEYSDPYNMEYLFIPANPTVNQKWGITGDDTLKVASINATVTTPVCSYTGCLQIDRIDGGSGSVSVRYYFKKGFGMVRRWYFTDDNLVNMTLN